MRARRIFNLALLLSLYLLPRIAEGQTVNFYWDTDGPTEGAGGATPTGTWDGTTTNWNTIADGTGDGTAWVDGNVAIFSAGTNATGTFTVTVGNTVTADSVNFKDGGVTLSGSEIDLTGTGNIDVSTGTSANIGSAVGGSVGLTKTGAGTLTLAGANLYSGPTTITGGTVAVGAPEVIPDLSAVSVGAGAILDVHNLTETVGSLTGTGNVTLGNGTLVSGGDDTSTIFSGVISGTGGKLTKTGLGILTLSGANTSSGATTIAAGTLQLGNANRIADTSAIIVSNVATFDLNNFSETIGSLAGGGSVTLGSGNLTTGADNSSTAYAGVISGAGRLVKNGNGVLTISGANLLAGGVTVTGGVLSFPGETSGTIGAANPLGATPASTIANYLTLSGGGTLRSTHPGAGGSFAFTSRGISIGTGGGVLDVTSSTTGDYLIYGGIVTGSGPVTKSGAGTLLLSAANTYTGNTTNSGGTLRIGTATVLGNISSSTLVLAGGNLSSPVDANTYIQNKLQLLANTTISGTPTASARAVVFGNSSIVTSNGTLTIRNTGGAAVAFQARFTNGGFNFSQPIVIGQAGDQPAQLDCYSDNLGATLIGDQIFNGTISGPGSVRRTCGGDGTGGKTIFSGTNTYTGGTALNGGFLGFGSDSVGSPVTSGPIGTGTLTIGQDSNDGFYSSGGAHTVRNTIAFGTGTNITIIGANPLTMSGAMVLPTAPTSLTVSNTALTTFSGVISGGIAGGSFIKGGNGTLAISGANSYTDSTLVSAGTLWVNNTTGSGTGTGTVTVNSGTTLGGKGIISGAVTINSGGKISPGTNSIGLLTLKNGANLSAGGTYVWELNANSTSSPGVNFDQISITGGTLVLGSTSKLTLSFAGTASVPNLANTFWRSAHSWTVIAGSGTATNSGLTRFTSVSSTQYPSMQYFTNTADASGNIILTYDPTSPFYPLSDSGPGFFGGENVILTNDIGLTLKVWSSATGGQSITNWTLEGTMGEQPLNDGSGKSRYSMNLNPAVSPVYYIVGKTTSGPYAPTMAVEWITTDGGSYTLFNTNVAINAAGVLDLPVPPEITQQPLSKTVLSGKNASFSVVASSYSSMGYQWRFNTNTALANAANSTLTVAAATITNIGTYDVVITNAHGSTLSGSAGLSVIPPPQLTVQFGTNGVDFSGSGVVGDSYWLEAATNLAPPIVWIPVATNVAGTNGLIQLSDTNAAAQPNRFYRLEAP